MDLPANESYIEIRRKVTTISQEIKGWCHNVLNLVIDCRWGEGEGVGKRKMRVTNDKYSQVYKIHMQNLIKKCQVQLERFKKNRFTGKNQMFRQFLESSRCKN